MAWSLTEYDLASYTANQLSLFSAPRRRISRTDLKPFLPEARERLERCFRAVRKKYFFENGRSVFSHLHGDHYSIYLYLLCNTIHRSGRRPDLAQAIFLLNKMLHGIDAYCALELPEIFLFIHPIGTVLGKAKYENFFMVYQNCTVGSTNIGTYPVFSEGTVLFSGSAVIGSCKVGRDVVFGANAFVLNARVPRRTTVVGAYPACRYLPFTGSVADRYFAS